MSRLPIRLAAAIIFFFSFLLFLSGYILQQQSLHALEKAIAPTALPPTPPPPPPRHNLKSQSSSPHPHPYLPALPPTIAYLQSVTTKSSLCNTLMLFSDLHTLGSSAARILYYPSSWDHDPSTGTWTRLLHTAKTRYNVLLRTLPEVSEKSVLAAAFNETQYKRVVWLDDAGTLLKSLDELLLTLPPAVVAVPRGWEGRFWVVTPGEGWVEGWEGAELVLPPRPWVVGIGEFRREGKHEGYLWPGQRWDPEEVREEVAYVSFYDEGVRMPWFGVETGKRPGGKEGEVWEGLYRRWERGRGEVCGLDLEPVR
ncbi:hypothetical protein K440DRAFT_657688 [Wilcoxina mikolae CBS 423.85]|nr:hypothetical protein K440DRAFT_657688 [Wilcoxina mikolae CBS 423.85]